MDKAAAASKTRGQAKSGIKFVKTQKPLAAEEVETNVVKRFAKRKAEERSKSKDQIVKDNKTSEKVATSKTKRGQKKSGAAAG